MEIVKKDLKPADVTITKITPTTTPVNKRQMDNLAKSNKNDNQVNNINTILTINDNNIVYFLKNSRN